MKKNGGYSWSGIYTKVEKAGLEDEIREGYEYEMTIALEIINDRHMVKASKDRTQLFADKPEFVITTDTGKAILRWCNEGKGMEGSSKEDRAVRDIEAKVSACKTVQELLSLYKEQPAQAQVQYSSLFTKKRQELIVAMPNQANHISTYIKESKNGTNNS